MEFTGNTQQRVPFLHGPGVEVVAIELFRDGTQSPWGFRLKGGADVDGGIPLEIIKVFVGSASDGLLIPGDILLSINNQNTEAMQHCQAQHIFKTSGTSARIVLARQHTQGAVRNSAAQTGHQPCTVGGVRGVGGAGQGIHHPGYVQAIPPQLPVAKEATISRPQESETFKMIMKAEMIGAKDQTSIDAKMFDKYQSTRPSSQTSDISDDSRMSVDPLLKNTSINQSSTFKKLMNSVLGETEF